MPRVEVIVKLNGQSFLLTEGDRIEKTVIIECNSARCASRHGQEKPQEVSLIDGQPMPEEGRQWLSIILPETSPQYTPMPPNFCGPTCARDFLVYQYIAPSSTGIARKVDCLPEKDLTPEQRASLGSPLVQKTYLPESTTMADVEASVGAHSLPEPTVIGQADGDPGDEHN